MSEEANTEKIKMLAHQWGSSLFGVADLRAFGKEDLLLPSSTVDPLPFAISLAYRLSDPVIEGIEGEPTQHYFHHYQRVNILLDTMALILNSAIQEMGYQAMPIAASQLIDWKKQRAHLSHKHIARAAGLGWIGRNNLLVNKRFGSRIRLVTVLTDLPLAVNAPVSRDCGACRKCLAICPASAIKEHPSDFDHVRCYEQLKTFSKTLHISHHICGVCVKACRGEPKNAKRMAQSA
jgi:epoxyqueuosine reductase QueG